MGPRFSVGGSHPSNGSQMREANHLEKELLTRVKECGYEIRREWLGSKVGANCSIRGKRVLFVDTSTPVEDRLEFLSRFLSEIDSTG